MDLLKQIYVILKGKTAINNLLYTTKYVEYRNYFVKFSKERSVAFGWRIVDGEW
jgi:hypothetical protein